MARKRVEQVAEKTYRLVVKTFDFSAIRAVNGGAGVEKLLQSVDATRMMPAFIYQCEYENVEDEAEHDLLWRTMLGPKYLATCSGIFCR